jgi:hypothetical protein
LHPAAKRMFAEQYKVSDCASLGYINLMEIVKTQEFLKSQNIPYKFMSYVNYWTVGDYLSPNGDFGVMGYTELMPIINSIDFSKWIFHRDRECIYDLAKANQDFHGDRFHPGITTHQQWADLVYQQITC